MFCTNASIKYFGDGVQTDFLFPYEYFEEDDIKVLLWNDQTIAYDIKSNNIDYSFVNASTIRFVTPPPSPPPAKPGEDPIENVVFIRITDIQDPMAVFVPGNAIRARDLNDNFDQLRFSVEEVRCLTTLNSQVLDYAWKKFDEDTLYSTDTWDTKKDDAHVATVKAIHDRFAIVNPDNIITTPLQNSGKWISDDNRVATTGAIAARHDNFVLGFGPRPNTYFTPGKLWIDDSTNKLSYWSRQGVWINVAPNIDFSEWVREAPADGQKYVRKDRQWVYMSPVNIGSSPPSDPKEGDLWYDTTRRTTFVYGPPAGAVGINQDTSGDEIQLDTSGGRLLLDAKYVWLDIRPVDESVKGVEAGSGITVTESNDVYTVSNSGVIDLVAGTNITITDNNAGTYTINSTGGGNIDTSKLVFVTVSPGTINRNNFNEPLFASVAFADPDRYEDTTIVYDWWEMNQDPFTGQYNQKSSLNQVSFPSLPGSYFSKSHAQCKVTITFKDGTTTEIWSNIVTTNDGLTIGPYIDEAPDDGKLYGRQGRNWVEIV